MNRLVRKVKDLAHCNEQIHIVNRHRHGIHLLQQKENRIVSAQKLGAHAAARRRLGRALQPALVGAREHARLARRRVAVARRVLAQKGGRQ